MMQSSIAAQRVLALSLLLSAGGCSLMKISEQAEFADNLAAVHGRVDIQSAQHGTVNVVLYRQLDHGLQAVNRSVLSGDGSYRINVAPGTYVLGAFIDSNGDGAYQPGEHASYVGAREGRPANLQLQASARTEAETIVIAGPIAVTVDIDERAGLNKAQLNTGRIASLDEAMFSDESARMGLWRPVDFSEQFGGGLMLLQPYDPQKTPVVFVHGISGSVRSFAQVIAALDQEQFQPWVLQYPSGVRLDVVSDYMHQALDKLHAQHGFRRVMIVAHSMGGLMTRSFVMKHIERQSPYQIALGVTINSPLQGMSSANVGVETSPIVVPVWRDMASNSEYVQRVNAWRWPGSIPYHLFFSFLPDEPGDGVVPLASQLSQPLQEQAVRIHGFQGEHTAVLADAQLIARLTSLLSSYGVDARSAADHSP